MSRETDTLPGAALRRSMDRRRFILNAAGGTVIAAGGLGLYRLLDDKPTRAARNLALPDGRPRLPPGQRLLSELKPMGGAEGDPSPSGLRLRVHGEVARTLNLSYRELLDLPQVEQTCDVHCVTGWTMFDSRWRGVRVSHLAKLAGVRGSAGFVIFEAAHGYTANVPLDEALRDDVLVAHTFGGDPLLEPHGAPVRALVPHLYFWKSAKWLTGIRFSSGDEPGYWEIRGYHNHGDPWTEERYG